MTRRHFFRAGAMGLGAAALASLLAASRAATPQAAVRRPAGAAALRPQGEAGHLPVHERRARRRWTLWDYKPKMDELFDKDLPESRPRQPAADDDDQRPEPASPSRRRSTSSARHGKSGTWVSELLPWTAKVVDELCVVKQRPHRGDQPRPGHHLHLHRQPDPRPAEPRLVAELRPGQRERGPAGVRRHDAVVDRPQGRPQALFNRLWGSGFLPSQHQGVALRSQGDPVLYLTNPDGVSRAVRRRMLDTLARLNQKHLDEVADPETQARIAQYEMAFRMQTSVPELMDLSARSRAGVRDLYGPDVDKPGTFAASLPAGPAAARARRALRADLPPRLGPARRPARPTCPTSAATSTRPCYGLITDLKQRGMLDDTLVVWGGEFGRTVYCQGKLTRDNYGRDHHPRCFPMWMAGGGIKPGIVYGETDDFSYNVVEGPGPHPRHERDDPALPGHRPQAADVQVPGAGRAADRRGGRRAGQGDPGVS